MTLYDVVTIPHPVLKTKSAPVDGVTDAIRQQMTNMLETMYHDNGIGLAANQVGIANRVLVMDLQQREDDGKGERNPIFIANPEIVWASEEKSAMEEGCLSIPGQYALVERPAIVKVEYLDFDGRKQLLEAQGLMSHCVQHEIDHLNGILCIDYLSALKRNMIIRRVEKAKKNQEIL